jgi:leader peptidase (prepilin peptidase)/N-methyltransferase
VSAPVWPYLAIPGLVAGIAARSAFWYLAVEQPPRRACPACASPPRHALAPVRPVTGRCPHCAASVPPPALVPELLGAGGFMLAGWLGGGGLWVAAVCWLVAFALPAVLVDARVQFLPEVLTWPCLAGVLALCLGQAAADGASATAVRTVLAGAAVAALFRVLVSAAGVGRGDLSLAPSLGIVLGYESWNAVVVGIAAGFCVAGLGVAASMVVRRRGPSGQVPFGPPLLAGAMLALCLTTR